MFDCKKEIINPELNNPHTFNPFVIENTVDSNQKSFLLASARLEQCVFTLLSTINHICHFFKLLTHDLKQYMLLGGLTIDKTFRTTWTIKGIFFRYRHNV